MVWAKSHLQRVIHVFTSTIKAVMGMLQNSVKRHLTLHPETFSHSKLHAMNAACLAGGQNTDLSLFLTSPPQWSLGYGFKLEKQSRKQEWIPTTSEGLPALSFSIRLPHCCPSFPFQNKIIPAALDEVPDTLKLQSSVQILECPSAILRQPANFRVASHATFCTRA